jgi:galactokinase
LTAQTSSAPSFTELFGRPPETAARAPGRVNLIGEHTDYNGGYVLPMATPQETRIELARRPDREVRVHSNNIGHEARPESYWLGKEARRGQWIDYVQGVTAALAGAGLQPSGFEALIASDVPLGSGLSSSAALEVALLRALRSAFAWTLGDVELALLAQRAENGFVGAPVGVMDPMAVSLADVRNALFLDTRSLAYELVPFPPGADLVILHSGIAHDNARGDYRTRRAECERAAELFGVPQLRDLSPADLPRIEQLPEPLGRRARHVVTENARVLAAVRAMRAGDVGSLGELFYESHRSMRDDFEVSIPEIDLLVDLARKDPAAYGARLTGGGFGGSVVMLAKPGSGRAMAERIARVYRARTGISASVLLPPEPAPTPSWSAGAVTRAA